MKTSTPDSTTPHAARAAARAIVLVAIGAVLTFFLPVYAIESARTNAQSEPVEPTEPVDSTTPADAQPTIADADDSNAPNSPPTPVPGTTWQLTFSDEFSGTALNTGHWANCFAPTYCSDDKYEGSAALSEAVVSGGNLHLSAHRNSTRTSTTFGAINSNNSYAFTYGYFEVRAKVPKGAALWPAFWTITRCQGCYWPPEIDVFETLGRDPATVHMTVHYNPNSQDAAEGKAYTGQDLSTDFHTYAVDWTRDKLVWYVDGVERFRSLHSPTQAMFLILDHGVATATGWDGPPDATTPNVSELTVDYVRVWQRVTATPTPMPTPTPLPRNKRVYLPVIRR